MKIFFIPIFRTAAIWGSGGVCAGEELAVHADIEDAEQTVTLTVPPAPYTPAPKTGDNSKLGFWIGLAAVALGGVISAGIIRIKSRKDDDE